MDAFIVEQRATIRSILNAVANYGKLAVTKRTLAVTESRLQLLCERWESCRKLDTQISIAAVAAKKVDEEYILNEEFYAAEAAFEEAHDFFCEKLASLRPHPTPSANSTVMGGLSDGDGPLGIAAAFRLPRIDCPKFSGVYTEWPNYKNIFESMVQQNETLNDVQGLHYLKSSLTGQASQLIQHFSISPANFQAAWDTLVETYEDERAIIDAHFKNFLSLPAMSTENANDLKNLRDRTREALRALNNLGCPTDSWDHLIVYLTVQKLDASSARKWEMQLGATSTYPDFKALTDFWLSRSRALEKSQGGGKLNGRNNSKSKPAQPTTEVRSHSATTATPPCLMCSEGHALYKCEQFKTQFLARRREFAKEKSLCFNCLRAGHLPRVCPSKYSCALCKKKHHTLLHPEAPPTKPENPNSSRSGSANTETEHTPKPASEPSVSAHHAQNSPADGQFTLLATAIVNLRTATGRRLRVRALMDQGSQSTLIKESVVQLLRPKRFPALAQVNGVGEVVIGTARQRVNVYVESSSDKKDAVAVSALVMPTLTGYIPRSCPRMTEWSHLSGLVLADPQPSSREPIDLIIGADYYGSLLRPGLRQGPICAPTTQATLFGWILSGPASSRRHQSDTISVHNCTTDDNLQATLARFWESRDEDGRYIVRLPFKEGPPISIGESLFRAKSMFSTVERRLQRDSGLRAEYNALLSEYEALGHMRAAPIAGRNETTPQCVYLPHHPVFRETSSTTRVRVVFNASSATSNLTSLNDHLLAGPKLLTDITTIITRWRAHRFAYIADIAKMFRQILVHHKDVDYQRILWRRDTDKIITSLQLLTVTYGTASAPFLAKRVLLQLARDEGSDFPKAERILRENFYVDDALFGADSVEATRQTRTELNQLLARGGFLLRKWSANVEELLADCVPEDHELASEVPLKELDSINVLGIAWNPNRDVFQYRFTPVPSHPITKRAILSIIARLYDPLGWVSPIVITAKTILQELWISKVDWDAELPDDLAERWRTYYGQLEQIEKASVSRWTGQCSDHTGYEIHGFADASSRAYAAVVYLRVLRDLDDAQVTMLIAKTKVAPVNPVSIPGLELCAAVLLARTLRKVMDDLNLSEIPVYAWSDSAVTLHWLNKHPSAWQTFVANRVAEVLSLVHRAVWRHVPTKDNPADCASRGLLPQEAIDHRLWWNGPSWLNRHSAFWPTTRVEVAVGADLEEKKSTHVHTVRENKPPVRDLAEAISSWPRLLRVTAYCLRFISRARSAGNRSQHEAKTLTCNVNVQQVRILISKLSFVRDRTLFDFKEGTVALSAREVSSASEVWIKLIQGQFFCPEISALREGRAIASSSSLRRLTPFLDASGILRVGGRLANAPIAYSEQHPIILPRHQISDLIVRQAHERTLHGGPRLTLKVLRQKFWILWIKWDNTLVKRIVRECVKCVRERAAQPVQRMADLPSARVSASSRPFLHTGVDYAGPLNVRLSKGRGYKSQKSYVALFVCFATRTVHLELVSDYATSGFLAAFRRFVARRGIPAAMYSDNGTNFIGADRELRNALRTVARDADLRASLIGDGTEWHFNPSAAPHCGGLWEAGVKSVNHHLRRFIGAHTLSFEELTTLLSQIEACLNSRPIAPLSNDPDDLTCLTPHHFLIGGPLIAIPEPSVLDVRENRLSRWQLVQEKVEIFWRRWKAEYLHSVQQRNKWSASQPNMQVGDLVLLRSQLLPPSKWQLGRILECHPGKDGHVRVVTVKTASSVLQRPIVQICSLPIRGETATTD